jgi:hypothetical protein
MSGAAIPRSLEQFIQLGRLGDALKRLNDGSDCGIIGIDRDLVASEVSALAGFSSDAKRLAERVFGLHPSSSGSGPGSYLPRSELMPAGLAKRTNTSQR